MKDVFLINYSVRGIKTLDKPVSLSFYKKTISKKMDTKAYNIKGIYGMNGSGKSAIVTSVDILKNILIDASYLNNPIIQKNLDAIINKKNEELDIEVDFVTKFTNDILYFRYVITLSKDISGKYVISYEKLSCKNAYTNSDFVMNVYEVQNGEVTVTGTEGESKVTDYILGKMTNLLSTASMCALFYEKIFIDYIKNGYKDGNFLTASLVTLFLFGKKIHVYMDQSDDHKEFLMQDSLNYYTNLDKSDLDISFWLKNYVALDNDYDDVIQVSVNYVNKKRYDKFVDTVGRLCDFLRIFKKDLIDIEVEKKENNNLYICNLVMIYDSYKIYAEFESTGIKKLIRLFSYLNEMVHGDIVFIDEFDSNLHDVYLCALLEYLMEYAQGQLCFTTHNLGPMDILKQNKKSIEFLSADGNIYPWIKNGNYSPSKLYRNGMIEGSPFNVDSIDFIGIFGTGEEDE